MNKRKLFSKYKLLLIIFLFSRKKKFIFRVRNLKLISVILKQLKLFQKPIKYLYSYCHVDAPTKKKSFKESSQKLAKEREEKKCSQRSRLA